MIYGYCRVSTIDQNLDQQIQLLKRSAFSFDKIFSEKATGKNSDRLQWQKLRRVLHLNDHLVVQSLDRLGRDTIDILDFINQCKNMHIQITILDLGSIDITSATGELVVSVLACIAQMTRTQMLEKQRIGIERAKEQGKYKGRRASPDTLKKFKRAKQLVENGKLSKGEAARAVGIGEATYYRYLKK